MPAPIFQIQFTPDGSPHRCAHLGAGSGIWLSVPNEVLKNSFYFPIDPPANMPLPYSDSAYYDYMAHSLLIGTDYLGEIPTRPLYILFLTVLHLLFGENYNLIIVGQTLVLAAFPVVFYALGKKLHSRLAGLTIALLAIFREWTNLLVSSDTRVSNTKTLLVDTPTLLLILLACLFAFRWLERKDKRSAFIAGGVFGILLLLRTQSMLILPVVFVVAFLALRSDKRPWLGAVAHLHSGRCRQRSSLADAQLPAYRQVRFRRTLPVSGAGQPIRLYRQPGFPSS